MEDKLPDRPHLLGHPFPDPLAMGKGFSWFFFFLCLLEIPVWKVRPVWNIRETIRTLRNSLRVLRKEHGHAETWISDF